MPSPHFMKNHSFFFFQRKQPKRTIFVMIQMGMNTKKENLFIKTATDVGVFVLGGVVLEVVLGGVVIDRSSFSLLSFYHYLLSLKICRPNDLTPM